MGEQPKDLRSGEDSIRLDLEADPTPQPGVLGSPAMDARGHFPQAVQALRRGEFEKALRYFARTLELDRSCLAAWIGQAKMFIELNELAQAELWVEKALGLFRGNGDLLSARAVLKARRGRHAEAIAFSDTALHSPGHSAYRWLARGEVLLASSAEEAEPCFEQAVTEPDADAFTWLWIARICRRHGRYTRALEAARTATERAPDSPFAWYIRGVCERDLAIRAYQASMRRALELDGTYAAARKALRERAGVLWLVGMFRRLRGL